MQTISTAHIKLLTRKEAANYLAVSQRKLDQLAATGTIRKVQIDTCVRFDRADLDSFVASRKSA